MAGRLTTHVLDTARGRPASDVLIELWQLDEQGERRRLVTTTRTNADGRTDAPLLEGADFVAGVHELVFAVGPYFAADTAPTSLRFLDNVPVRFGIADGGSHYHVPLLVSPWSYSTYRGS